MKHKWFHRATEPAHGKKCEVFGCSSNLKTWNGRVVTVIHHIETEDMERLCVVMTDQLDTTVIKAKNLRSIEPKK